MNLLGTRGKMEHEIIDKTSNYVFIVVYTMAIEHYQLFHFYCQKKFLFLLKSRYRGEISVKSENTSHEFQGKPEACKFPSTSSPYAPLETSPFKRSFYHFFQ